MNQATAGCSLSGKAHSFTPKALQTFEMVSNLGCESGRNALYKASREIPDDLATSVIPRALAISPSASASNAASFSSKIAVKYAAISSLSFK